MKKEIHYFGHSGFKITCAEVSVVIDPFITENPCAKISCNDIGDVDIVLVTHMHGDHYGDAIPICKKTGAMLGATVESVDALKKLGLPDNQVINKIGFCIGGTISHKEINITMVEAMHSVDIGLPVGYIITLPDGFTIYHAGDTGVFSNMALWGELYPIDLALLPIGGVYTMDARQAAHAAKLLKAKAVVPMHWKTFPMLAQSSEEFEHELGSLVPDCNIILMQPGETVTL